jgi:hypothetical protein
MNLVRIVFHKVWMILGIPFWIFTEEGPIGYFAGRITDWWIRVGDDINPPSLLPPK